MRIKEQKRNEIRLPAQEQNGYLPFCLRQAEQLAEGSFAELKNL
jgi:hypothetical protein